MDDIELADLCDRLRNGSVRIITYKKSRHGDATRVFVAGRVSEGGLTAEGGYWFRVIGNSIYPGAPGRAERFSIWRGPSRIATETVLPPDEGESVYEPDVYSEAEHPILYYREKFRRYFALNPVRLALQDAVIARIVTDRPVVDA